MDTFRHLMIVAFVYFFGVLLHKEHWSINSLSSKELLTELRRVNFTLQKIGCPTIPQHWVIDLCADEKLLLRKSIGMQMFKRMNGRSNAGISINLQAYANSANKFIEKAKQKVRLSESMHCNLVDCFSAWAELKREFFYLWRLGSIKRKGKWLWHLKLI